MDYLTEARRRFLIQSGTGVGAMALSTLFNPALLGSVPDDQRSHPGLPQFPNFAPRAKRLIYLFMAGGPNGAISTCLIISLRCASFMGKSSPIRFAKVSASRA